MKPKIRYVQLSLLAFFLVFNLSSCQKKVISPKGTMLVNERTRLIVDEQQNVRPAVVALMKITGLENKTHLHDVVVLTQKSWLRPLSLERMHLDEPYPRDKDTMLKHFENLGLTKAIMPKAKHYDYVFLLGSTYQGVKERLLFLESLARLGFGFKTLVLLGSHRPLERFHEVEPMITEERFDKMPVTEIEMMEALFAESQFKSMNKKQILSIASPMKTLADNRIVRANTRDTILDFTRMKKRPGSVLVISSQPFALRQHLVVHHALGSAWTVETVGGEASSRLNSAIFLDELARTLFEIEAASTK